VSTKYLGHGAGTEIRPRAEIFRGTKREIITARGTQEFGTDSLASCYIAASVRVSPQGHCKPEELTAGEDCRHAM
jgi:hypothetical protein